MSEGDPPDWRRENEEMLRNHDIPQYEPSKFSDGVPARTAIHELEERYDIDIQLRSQGDEFSEWQVLLNGDQVTTVHRERTKRGFSRFDLSSTALEDEIRNHVESPN